MEKSTKMNLKWMIEIGYPFRKPPYVESRDFVRMWIYPVLPSTRRMTCSQTEDIPIEKRCLWRAA